MMIIDGDHDIYNDHDNDHAGMNEKYNCYYDAMMKTIKIKIMTTIIFIVSCMFLHTLKLTTPYTQMNDPNYNSISSTWCDR